MKILTPWKKITSSTFENDNIQAFKNDNICTWKIIISYTLENDDILAFKNDNIQGVIIYVTFGVIIYLMMSFNVIIFDVIIWCYHFMLSFDVIFWCYYLFNVILWCYHFSQFANVIIFVLSFFHVQHGCYHFCYHLMLSFFVIISPLFLFPENVTHSKKIQYIKMTLYFTLHILMKTQGFCHTVIVPFLKEKY
jgi:hypothetical protein